MKRFLSVFITIMMLLNSAVLADGYDFLKTEYTSYEANLDISMDVDDDVDFLDSIPGMEYARNFVDAEGLVKGLSQSEYNGIIKMNTNSDYTKAQLSLEMFSKIPMKINRNLRVTTEAEYGFWVDYDLTDENAPKLEYIYSAPVLDKYLCIDVISMLEEDGMNVKEYISALKSMTEKKSRKELTEKIIEIIKNNSSAEEKGSKTVITITNEQIKELVSQIFDSVSQSTQDIFADGSTFKEDMEEAFFNLNIREKLEDMQIFADEALKLEITKGSDGNIKNAKEQINFAVNLEDITGETDTEELPIIKFSIAENVDYDKVNKGVTIDFPKLTEDNSLCLRDMINNQGYVMDYDWDGECCWHNENIYIREGYIPSETNAPYCSVKKILDSLEEYGYKYDMETDGDFVTITDKNQSEGFSKAVIKLDSNEITVDGVEYTGDSKAILSEDKVLVDFKALELIFGLTPTYSRIELDDEMVYGNFIRKSPQCHHTLEEISNENDYYEYECEHFQRVYADDDRPYKGTKYFCLRYVTGELFEYGTETEHGEYYDLSYDNGVVTLVDLYGKESFNKVIFTNGSNEINIDGEIFRADAPVEIENGTTYVDASAISRIFGTEMTYQALDYDGGYYDDFGECVPLSFRFSARLRRKLPTCTHEVTAEY